MPQPNRYALIVAGGSGTRMGVTIPKQFLPVKELPVLMHTIRVFSTVFPSPIIFVVLPNVEHERWSQLCKKHVFDIPHTIVSGGETRYHSVKNGLSQIQGDGLVAIHDGVRPLVTAQLIEKCFLHADKNGNAIPAVRPVESVRYGDFFSSRKDDRNQVWLVQTPQVFRLSDIKSFYTADYNPLFTDDASVAEDNGQPILIVEGERENIKITTPIDLAFANAILEQRLNE
jgi:2-C-methyl-D-erythritol 4-phosphate cytidylyltransferase